MAHCHEAVIAYAQMAMRCAYWLLYSMAMPFSCVTCKLMYCTHIICCYKTYMCVHEHDCRWHLFIHIYSNAHLYGSTDKTTTVQL